MAEVAPLAGKAGLLIVRGTNLDHSVRIDHAGCFSGRILGRRIIADQSI
jgi:hypothetical protein